MMLYTSDSVRLPCPTLSHSRRLNTVTWQDARSSAFLYVGELDPTVTEVILFKIFNI